MSHRVSGTPVPATAVQQPCEPLLPATTDDAQHDGSLVQPELSSFVLLNGQSVSPAATSTSRWKIPFIQETITERSCPPPFVAVTESWLKSYITDAQVAIKDYQVYRSDRPDRVGGGCLLYVHDQLVVTDTDHYEDQANNMVLCYVKARNTVIATVYRPPGTDSPGFKRLLDKLQRKIDDISENSVAPDLYIVGDFNLPDLDWKLSSAPQGKNGADLIDFVNRNFLTQVVEAPTRESRTLDLVLTNVPRYVTEVKVNPTSLSDHSMVEVLLGYNMLRTTEARTSTIDPLSFRSVNYHEADFDGMKVALSEVNWVKLWDLCEGDLDKFLELLRLTVLQITLKFSPKKQDHQNQQPAKKKRGGKLLYVMKRRKRKINARIRALQEKNPSSPRVPKLQRDVSLIAYDIQEDILGRLNKKELRAV